MLNLYQITNHFTTDFKSVYNDFKSFIRSIFMTKKTVLITGSSTGIGRETALYFQRQGWNVAATMRTPQKEKELGKLPHVITPALDVTSQESIKAAIEE